MCFGNGVAKAGQYRNVATATGTGPTGTKVTATDPSHYFGSLAELTLEKATNGQDADTPPGPRVPVGSAVTWTYVVKNTGNADLLTLKVTDDRLGPVECPVSSLAAGASTTCTATGTAVEGQYQNYGTATAVTASGTKVSDTDPSHYFGAAPGILVEKATNGKDADDAPGPLLQVGAPVDWTYVVTNTANTTLTTVAVVDSRGVAVRCPKSTLAPNESMTCTGRGTATVGQYENLATATGVDGAGVKVSDQDRSHYFGYTSSVRIEKRTNGQDADTPPGPGIPVGDPVTWTYVVTNTGNLPIQSFTVTDSDPSVTVVCPPAGIVLPGASVTCTATGVAKPGAYRNVGTVVALDVLENTLTAKDPSHYDGGGVAGILPPTGSRATTSTTWALVLLVTGFGLVVVARRRRA